MYGIITDRDVVKKYIKYDEYEDGDKIFDKQFKEWRCNLRLGREIYISTEDMPRKLRKGEYACIRPGEFVLFLTKETLKLDPDVMAFISIRFDYKQKGLVNVSGFHVDPRYSGKLIFSAYNAGPKDIVLRESDAVFMIFFQKLEKACEKEHEGYNHIPAKMVEQLRGKSATLASNAHRLERLEFYLKMIGGIVVALLMTIVGVAIKRLQ